jgi:hypothetical protein
MVDTQLYIITQISTYNYTGFDLYKYHNTTTTTNNKQPHRGMKLHTLQHRDLKVHNSLTTFSLGHLLA